MYDGDPDSDDLDWDEVARVPDESEGCFATVPSQEIAKPKRNYDLPHPSKRTKEQHVFAAHMMPGRKAMMTSRRVKQQSKEQANNATALLRDSFFLLDQRTKNKQVRGVDSIVADGQRRFPASTTINRACTQQKFAQQTWRRHSTAIHRWSLKHARLLHMPLA